MYGWSQRYYTTESGGRNSRLDEMQAALLRVSLAFLTEETALRRERADWYRQDLAGLPLQLPPADPGHVYHLYVITLPDRASRDALRSHLHTHGIGAEVHYPTPAHLQPAFSELGFAPGSLPVTEDLAGRILSLPLSPDLTREEVALVAETVRSGVQR
jgi:dTDP-4-amino-4,6-dideoxygalactose transaminase